VRTYESRKKAEFIINQDERYLSKFVKNFSMFRILLICGLLVQSVFAQKLTKSDKEIIKYLKQQVGYLSSDELKGRRAGDPGELLAASFLSEKFKEIGLTPKGNTNTYFQEFIISDGKRIGDNTSLKIDGVLLRPTIDFFPLANSKNGMASGESSPSLRESGQPWISDLSELIEENKNNPHFDLYSALSEKTKQAFDKGATAILFFNSSAAEDNMSFQNKDKSEPTPIPAFYVNKKAAATHLKDVSSTYKIDLNSTVVPKTRTARNVMGYLDNNAEHTVVIGAHFDHLGYGEDGNSMIRSGEPSIHNGADDNASGTSAMIELAFLMKQNKIKNHNYLFIGFSAEELGLNGSKYFVENPTIPLNQINYMINMDMVGRLNDSSKTITIGGYGTSPSWKTMIDGVKNKNFFIRIDSSGTGPSDHTSFYRKDIPVLFFFTGLHTDYHKPSDDADKINYTGMLYIVRFIQHMIQNDKQDQKLVFTKTREQQTSTSARFSVSMGIMPDYTYTGNGVRVDGLSDNRPAQKAGIATGDIVKQVGDYKTPSVESYMQALSKFKKGDQAKVLVLRGEKELSFEIIF
jgi:hypothetical protein